MMQSHFFLLVLFSLFIALVFAVLLREEPREQLRFGAFMFATLIGVAFVLGWLMFPVPL
jgi:hypothetical protein